MYTTVAKMPGWKAWVQRKSGLIKMSEAQALLLREGRVANIKVNFDYQS